VRKAMHTTAAVRKAIHTTAAVRKAMHTTAAVRKAMHTTAAVIVMRKRICTTAAVAGRAMCEQVGAMCEQVAFYVT
jgi:hypothetical protein